MSNEEIVRDYKQSKNRLRQIGILADLTGYTKQRVVEILLEADCDVPKQFLPKKKDTEWVKAEDIDTEPKKPDLELTEAWLRVEQLEAENERLNAVILNMAKVFFS